MLYLYRRRAGTPPPLVGSARITNLLVHLGFICMDAVTPAALRTLAVFEELPDEVLTWFLAQSRYLTLEKGEALFEEALAKISVTTEILD